MADNTEQQHGEVPVDAAQDGAEVNPTEERALARLRRVPLVASLAERVEGAAAAVRGGGGVVSVAFGLMESTVYVATAVATTTARPFTWALHPQLVKAERLVVRTVDFLETKFYYSDSEVPEDARPAVSSTLGSVAGAVASALSGGVSASRSLLRSLSHNRVGHKLLAGLDHVLCRTEEYIDCYLTAGDSCEAVDKTAHPLRRAMRLASRGVHGLYNRGARVMRQSCSGFEQEGQGDGEEKVAAATRCLPRLFAKSLSPFVWLASRSASAVNSAVTAVVNRAYNHAINNSSLNWVVGPFYHGHVFGYPGELVDDL